MIRTDTPEKYAEDLVIIIVVGNVGSQMISIDGNTRSNIISTRLPVERLLSIIGQKDTAHRLSKRERFSASAIG
jgi:hypothetical protein